MRSLTRRVWILATAAMGFLRSPTLAAVGVGDTAPDFSLPATKGGTVSLSQFRGKKNVVIAFFPKAFTGG